MRFAKFLPATALRPYVKCIAVSEHACAQAYSVLPTAGLVIGFQYRGHLSIIKGGLLHSLKASGITGIANSYKAFRSSANTGTLLVYFTETGFAHFSGHPAHELYDQSLSLKDIFDRSALNELEEQLPLAASDGQRIALVEQFLWSQLQDIQADQVVAGL